MDSEEQIKDLQENVKRLEEKLRASEQANSKLLQRLDDLQNQYELLSKRLDHQVGMKVSQYLSDNRYFKESEADTALRQTVHNLSNKVQRLGGKNKVLEGQIESLQNQARKNSYRDKASRAALENQTELGNLKRQLAQLPALSKLVEEVKQARTALDTVQYLKSQQDGFSKKVDRMEAGYDKVTNNFNELQLILENDIEELNKKTKNLDTQYKDDNGKTKESVALLEGELEEMRQQLHQHFYDKSWIDKRLKEIMDAAKDTAALEELEKEFSELKGGKIAMIGKKLEQIQEQTEADRKSLQDALKAQASIEQLEKEGVKHNSAINQLQGDVGQLKKEELSVEQINKMVSRTVSKIRQDIIESEITAIEQEHIGPLQTKLTELRKKVDAKKEYEEWFRLFPSADAMQRRLDQLEKGIDEAKQQHEGAVSNEKLEERLNEFKKQVAGHDDERRQNTEEKLRELEILIERLSQQQLSNNSIVKTVQEEFDIQGIRDNLKSLRVEFNKDFRPYANKLPAALGKEQLHQALDLIKQEFEEKINLQAEQVAKLPGKEALEKVDAKLGEQLEEIKQEYAAHAKNHQEEVNRNKSQQKDLAERLSQLDQVLTKIDHAKNEQIAGIEKKVALRSDNMEKDIDSQRDTLQDLKQRVEQLAAKQPTQSAAIPENKGSSQEKAREVTSRQQLHEIEEQIKGLQQQNENLQSQIDKSVPSAPDKQDIIATLEQKIESENSPVLRLINRKNEEEIFPQFNEIEADVIELKKKLNALMKETAPQPVEATQKPQASAKASNQSSRWQALEFFTAQPNIDGVFPQSKLSREFIPRKNFYRILLDSDDATTGKLFLIEDDDTLSTALNAPDTYLTACEFRTIDKNNFDRSKVQPGQVSWDGKNWRVSKRVVI